MRLSAPLHYRVSEIFQHILTVSLMYMYTQMYMQRKTFELFVVLKTRVPRPMFFFLPTCAFSNKDEGVPCRRLYSFVCRFALSAFDYTTPKVLSSSKHMPTSLFLWLPLLSFVPSPPPPNKRTNHYRLVSISAATGCLSIWLSACLFLPLSSRVYFCRRRGTTNPEFCPYSSLWTTGSSIRRSRQATPPSRSRRFDCPSFLTPSTRRLLFGRR